jgi:hypothetical protein
VGVLPRGGGVGPRIEGAHDRRTAARLHGDQAGQWTFEPAELGELLPGLPHADESRAAARGIEHHLRQPPSELHRKLEAHRLLALDAVGLFERRHVEPAVLRLAGLDQPRAVVDEPLHPPHLRTLERDLTQVDLGSVVGAETEGFHPSARGVGRHRRPGVAVGWNRHPAHAMHGRHRDRDAKSPRLERTGRQPAFILHERRAEARRPGTASKRHERGFELTETDDVG